MVSMLKKESRVAAIYDIHGNLPALEAVLTDLERIEPDLLIVGGDVASGPMPAEILDRLTGLGEGVRFVRGNADREVISAYEMSPSEIEARMDDPVVHASGWVSRAARETPLRPGGHMCGAGCGRYRGDRRGLILSRHSPE
jgi:Icc-related predicted phosphoesterase